ncbi:MAG: diguanylate cyclase, partial [Pedobacter sp.]
MFREGGQVISSIKLKLILVSNVRYKFTYTLLALLVLLFAPAVKSVAQTAYLPHYTTKNGLPSNNCFYILQDKKGYIWVATEAGVSRFDGTAFETFTVDDGLPDNQVLQVREDSKGRIWFLALNGQLSYFYNGKIYNQTNEKLLKKLNFNAVIVSFFEDRSGKIWFGTNKNIICVWDGETLFKYTSPSVKTQYANAYIHQDKQGNIWAYSTDAVFVFIKNNFVLVNDKMLPISYKTFFTAKDHSIFYLNKDGLNLKKGSETNFLFKIEEKLLNNNPGYIYANDKELWLSNNNGVYVIDYTGKAKQLLIDVDVNQVIKDSDNNMWFTTKNGIYRLPEEKERLYTINTSNGLNNDFVKSITKDQQDRVWLGLNNNNINIFNPKGKTVEKLKLANQEKYNLIKQITYNQKDGLVYFASDYGLGSVSATYPENSKVNHLS